MENTNKHYVYVLLNPLQCGSWKYKDVEFENSPFYVGVGIDNRANTHSTKSNLDRELNEFKKSMIETILAAGKKVIIHKIYHNLSMEEAKQKEVILIKYFGRMKYDYKGILTNLSPGADTSPANMLGSENIHSKNVYQYSLDGLFIKKWECLRCITRNDEITIHYNTIGDSCRKNSTSNSTTYSAGGFMWFYDYKGLHIKPYFFNNGQSKVVYRYCLRTLNFLNSYQNSVDAAKDIDSSKGAVSKACNNKIRLREYIYSHTKLSKKELKNIQNKYRYYKISTDCKEYICFSLTELNKFLNLKKETLIYLKTYNKLPNIVYINEPKK